VKILVADDELATQRVLQGLLTKQGYEVLVTRDGPETMQLLERDDAPAIVILDWLMPGIDGIDICRRVREWSNERYIYIIMLSAKTEKEDFVAGLDAGMDDYLAKPFHPDELLARVRVGERILALQHDLRVQATRDHLTGLFNRGTVIEIAQRELAQSQRKGEHAALVLADLDNFKRVNDTYGHQAGDAVLCEAARRLSARVRVYDVLGRYGGEEFLVLLPGCDPARARSIAERLRAVISAEPVDTPAGQIPITMSFGLAVLGPGENMSWDDLVLAADQALYEAKRKGRNRLAWPPRKRDRSAKAAGATEEPDSTGTPE
jgi:diguanylate cyclase (GGDEF)-like protein